MPYIRCKIPYTTKPLSIIFPQTNGSIKDCDRKKYLTLIPANEKDKGF